MRRLVNNLLIRVIILFASTCFVMCSSTKHSVLGSTYVVDNIVDLKGDTLYLPHNGTLVFKGKGCLKNGTIVGSETKINSSSSPLFEHIHVEGEWVISEIRSDYFKDIADDDVLKEVFALASDKVHNVIKLEKKDYWVTATDTNKFALVLKSNTELQNNGTIRMRPNGLISYAIVATMGDNITIEGGSYVGERELHRGDTGQWGHGIRVTNGSSNITVRKVDVRNCWGDGIAVEGNIVNSNVIINKFKIDNCRRQGISVIYADDCFISNGVITNIQGTEPYLGIDIEPNANGYCHNITIDNVTIESAKGIGIFTALKDYQVKDVTIKNCRIKTTDYSTIYAARCDSLIIKDNSLYSSASGIIAINSGVKNCQLLSNDVQYSGTDNTSCCIFNSAENTLIKGNTIKGTTGIAFYTNSALIRENTIIIHEFMTSADNATHNVIQSNEIFAELNCRARGNTFNNNNIYGEVRLNGGDCLFSNNLIRGKALSGTPYNGRFVNNKVIVEESFQLNGNVIINSNDIRSPKVLLKTGTKASNNSFIQTKENETDSFITLYGDSFEGNSVQTKMSKAGSTVTYIYCTSEGTIIKNNKFAAAPGIKYWLYSSKNLKLSNNQPAKKQIYQAGAETITD